MKYDDRADGLTVAHDEGETMSEEATPQDGAPLPIYRIIPQIIAEMKAIGKDSQNTDQNYKFRGIEDVMPEVKRVFAAHGVFILPTVLDRIREERATRSGGVMTFTSLRMRFEFCGPAGDKVEAITWGEGGDTSDKSTNKAMTAAFKYALNQVLLIAGMEDGDRESPGQEGNVPQAKTTAPRGKTKVSVSPWVASEVAELQSIGTLAGVTDWMSAKTEKLAKASELDKQALRVAIVTRRAKIAEESEAHKEEAR